MIGGCGLWFAKNWLLTGNPTYPLLYGLFGGETWTAEKAALFDQVHRPHVFTLRALWTELYRVVMGTDWLSPLVFPLAALSLLVRKHRAMIIGLWLYIALIIALWWLFTLRIDRFWVPAFSILALLAGAGACWCDQKLWRYGVAAVLVLGLAFNFLLAGSRATGYNKFFVPLAELRTDPERIDPWHLYFNRHASDGRILMVGEAQVFDLEMPILYNTWLDDSIFERLVRDPATGRLREPQAIRARFREKQITHVYVHWGEIQRYRSTGYGGHDFIQPEVFETLVRAGVLAPLPPIEDHPGRAYLVLI
jgi:hypothetical protein